MDKGYTVRPTPLGSRLKPRSYSILSNVNMCPIWGIVRYVHLKRYDTEARAMALEAGSAMHEVFAALRLHQLGRHQGYMEHAVHHGDRIFGKQRWRACWKEREDFFDEATTVAFNILHSGPFFDDPDDRVRTVGNMEGSILAYVEQTYKTMDKWSIWVADPGDPTKPVGVEIAFDVMMGKDGDEVRFIGTCDGIYQHDKNGLHIGENKYIARITRAWRDAFDMSMQPTAYMLGVEVSVGVTCRRARVLGLKNMQTGGGEEYADFVPWERKERDLEVFIDWVHHTNNMITRYENDWENAPRYTHSCSRWFRTCSQMAFCNDTPEGRQEQFEQMVLSDLSPSEQAVMDRIGVI